MPKSEDLGLVLGDELVQKTFPVLIGMAHPHSNSIDHVWSGRFLDERRDLHRDFGALREIASDRPPKDGGINAAAFEIRDHRRCRRVKPRIDHERIGFDVLQKPIDREIGRGGVPATIPFGLACKRGSSRLSIASRPAPCFETRA